MQLITFRGSIFVFCLSTPPEMQVVCIQFSILPDSAYGGGSPTFPFSGAAQNFLCLFCSCTARAAAEKFSKLPHPKYLSNHSCDCWPKRNPNAQCIVSFDLSCCGWEITHTPTERQRQRETHRHK